MMMTSMKEDVNKERSEQHLDSDKIPPPTTRATSSGETFCSSTANAHKGCPGKGVRPPSPTISSRTDRNTQKADKQKIAVVMPRTSSIVGGVAGHDDEGTRNGEGKIIGGPSGNATASATTKDTDNIMAMARTTTSVGVSLVNGVGSRNGGGEVPGAYAMGGLEADSAMRRGNSRSTTDVESSSCGSSIVGIGGRGSLRDEILNHTEEAEGEDLVATPIIDEDDSAGCDTAIQHARPTFPQENKNNAKNVRTMVPCWWRKGCLHGFVIFGMGAVLFALSVFVGIYVGFSTQREGTESNSTTAPTMNPISTIRTSAPTEGILMGQLLPSQMQVVLEDPDSPQSLAYEWLLNDPNLDTYPLWRRVQRYAVATLFLATDGPNSWKRNDLWLEYDYHECTWAQVGGWDAGAFDNIDSFVSEVVENLLNLYETGRPNSKLFVAEDDVYDHCDDDGKILLLRLANNGLDGIIPPQLGLLTSVEQLVVYGNELLGGEIPTELGLLTNLCNLHFASNHGLTGLVPSQIGLLTNMGHFALADMSGLTGTIPSEIGLMSNAFAIHLPKLRINGPLPSEIGELQNLRLLHTQGSFLKGAAPVPTEFFGLSKLQYLNAAGSFFQSSSLSSPPPQIYKMSNLEILDLSSNGITGWFPTQLSLLTNLRFLNLGNNNMSGALPSQLGLLSNTLEFLQLHSNDFSGEVPAQLGLLTNLLDLTLFDNPLLSGTIPDQACVMTVISQGISGGIFFNCSTTTNLCGCGQCNCSSLPQS